LNKEDILLSLKLSKKLGIIRFIQSRKKYFNPESRRWVFNYKEIHKKIFEFKPVLTDNFDILDFIYKNNDPSEVKRMIHHGGKKRITFEKWSETVSKEEIKSNRENNLKYINGHDLTLYLYCIKTMRNNKIISEKGWENFEYRLRKEAIKDKKYWEGFLDNSKIGRLLLS